MELSKRGLAYSIVSSLLFAIMPAYFLYMAPLSSLQILVLRVIWTFIVMLIFLFINKQTYPFVMALKRALHSLKLFLSIFFCALIMAIHQAFFVFGPTHGILLDVAMGYFLSPLILIAIGRTIYKEPMSILQAIAVSLAIFGVTHQLLATYALSWVTSIIATTYPIYLILRRQMEMPPVIGYLLEMAFLLPIATIILFYVNPINHFKEAPIFWLLIPGLGLITAGAFVMLISASKMLPLGLLGILSYLEPGLLFLFSVLFLKEPIKQNELWTYIPILIAIVFVIIDSSIVLKKQMRRTAQLKKYPL